MLPKECRQSRNQSLLDRIESGQNDILLFFSIKAHSRPNFGSTIHDSGILIWKLNQKHFNWLFCVDQLCVKDSRTEIDSGWSSHQVTPLLDGPSVTHWLYKQRLFFTWRTLQIEKSIYNLHRRHWFWFHFSVFWFKTSINQTELLFITEASFREEDISRQNPTIFKLITPSNVDDSQTPQLQRQVAPDLQLILSFL